MVRQHGETLDSVALTTAVALDCLALPEVAKRPRPHPRRPSTPTPGSPPAAPCTSSPPTPRRPASPRSPPPWSTRSSSPAANGPPKALPAGWTRRYGSCSTSWPTSAPPQSRPIRDRRRRTRPANHLVRPGPSQLIDRFGPHVANTSRAPPPSCATAAAYPTPNCYDDLSTILGNVGVRRRSWSTDRHGNATWTDHHQPEAVMEPSEIFSLPPFQALLVAGGIGGALIHLIPWWQRRDADTVRRHHQHALQRSGRTTP